ncbi:MULTISPECIES: porin [Glaesserella]|uniref:Porin n=1 Tax=Glaesserella australis TaxID=2094024 RepID=A0A328C3V9_9PAST|nr:MULTISPECIES: porin [Glaesserella]AUI65532.1 porin [Glaesserella sp. 15-184]RAL19730.1 porin [Glaesserella australis]
MKKTLVALVVTAFAASASAVTVYDNEGTKVTVDGSLRLLLDKGNTKVKDGAKTEKHSNLKNNGSRFGVRAQHQIAEDFYALGRLELRFDGTTSTTDQFGDVYAKRAYVGLGSKQFGEVTFGRQVTIADDIGETGFDYAYGVSPGLMTDAGNSVVRYDYKGIEGLQVGVNYNFAEKRDSNNEVVNGQTKNGYGVGATYTFQVAEGQAATVEAGYTRDNYATGTNTRHYKDAWEVAASYTVNGLKVAIDGSQAYEKEGSAKTRTSALAVGAKYGFDKVGVYGAYGYEHVKVKGDSDKTRSHKFLLGADYQLHKHVVTFVEGRIVKTKVDNGSRTTDNVVGVGLRVFW